MCLFEDPCNEKSVTEVVVDHSYGWGGNKATIGVRRRVCIGDRASKSCVVFRMRREAISVARGGAESAVLDSQGPPPPPTVWLVPHSPVKSEQVLAVACRL
uniref:Uncharacterized protein n=1 Tax=Physcomitrium patens TaxID=3218 RepID=A0A2K1J7K3_PHYPA|nr:hypothetical protein PHYPA_020611 [Physcomitrium patens]